MQGQGEHQDKFKIIKEIFNINQHVSGEEYIKELLKNIAKYLDIDFIFVGRPKEGKSSVIVTDFAISNGQFIDNLEYDLEGTPCHDVITGKRVCMHANNVCLEFPEDLMLQDMDVDAYIGAPILLPSGDFLGLIVFLSTNPIKDPSFVESAVDLFASRIGVELAMISANQRIDDLNEIIAKEVKEKEEMIKKTHETLLEQEKLAALGRLTTGIAHEIRNPLNLILNAGKVASSINTRLIEGDNKRLKDLKKALDIITTHSLRIKNILEIMLDTRVNGKKRYSLKMLVEESYKYAQHALSLHNDGVEIKFEHSLNTSEDLHVFTNDIQSVFINLYENSIYALHKKFSRSQGQAILSVHTYEKGQDILIEVKDNGVGIAENILNNIFEPFFTTKSGREGSGLGMSIIKSIVEKNNGEIFVESKEGEFTIFKIRFPKESS
ncbi:GAF domain-containing sensor histidine kinase [Halobacteriovorax sp. HFRX-2_2]|uniref:ATP-binding protein n=1 Tax=unclassified Halobacteriovorax TaxID=2639665 RepID=UPI003717CA70